MRPTRLASRKNIILISSIAVVILIVGVSIAATLRHKNSSQPPQADHSTAIIHVTEDGFLPKTVLIKTGTAVIWSNVDTGPHRIAAQPYRTHASLPGLDSKTNIDAGGSYRFVFTHPGTYTYQDELNPDMTGTVLVK